MYRYTVIIPHFKDASRLRRLLLSLPERRDIQIIVVDDCSPDQKSILKLKSEFIHMLLLSTTRNSGAGVARNIGLEFVKGRFVLFADSDDEFLPNSFDTFDKKILNNIDISYFTAYAWQEKTNISSIRADKLNGLCKQFLKDSSEKNLLKLKLEHCVPWAKVYRADFIKNNKIKFDSTFVSNDVYFNVINAVLAKNIMVYEDVVYRVYKSEGSLTSSPTAERLLQRVKVLAKTSNKLYELGIKERRSASGYILESVYYGPATLLKVLFIVINSKLKLNLWRVFEFRRWFSFFKNKKKLNKEI